MALTKVKAGNIILTTPGASSNDVTPATTQYVTTALANLADSAPSTLNTLNELAAALGDDANYATTTTNAIAAKLAKAGGTMTGALIVDAGNSGLDIRLGTDKRVTWSGNLGEIGSVAGFQAINTAGSALASFGMRGTDLRFATGSAERMRITDAGINVTGTVQADNLTMLDSEYIRLGASNDLQIFHDGNHSMIQDLVGTGALKIKSNDTRFEDADGNNIIKATSTAAELYFSGGKKLFTTAAGVEATAITTTGVVNNFTTTSSWGRNLLLTNTNNDVSPPIMTFLKAPAGGHTQMADNDYVGFINFRGDNTANQEHSWVEIAVRATDVSDGSEDSKLTIGTWGDGTEYGNTLVASSGKVGIGTATPPHMLSIFGGGTSSPQATSAANSYTHALFRVNNFTNSSVGLSIGSTGGNTTHIQTSYNEGTTSPLALNPFGGNVLIGAASPYQTAKLQIHGAANAGGSAQLVGIKSTATASYSSTSFLGVGRVIDCITNSNDAQDYAAIRFTNPGGSRETAIACVSDQATTRDGTLQGDVVIQGYDGDAYIETQRFRANGASSSTGQRRTGTYTSFALMNHTYTFDHAGYSGAGTPANSNAHWLEIPLYSSYSSSAGGGWCEIDICWHATHAQAAHLHSYKIVWGSNHARVLNVAVASSNATVTPTPYASYAFISSSRLYRHPTAGEGNMAVMYIEIKGSTNHSGARSITVRGVGHPSVKNIAPIIDHAGDATPDGITPTAITTAITATG